MGESLRADSMGGYSLRSVTTTCCDFSNSLSSSNTPVLLPCEPTWSMRAVWSASSVFEMRSSRSSRSALYWSAYVSTSAFSSYVRIRPLLALSTAIASLSTRFSLRISAAASVAAFVGGSAPFRADGCGFFAVVAYESSCATARFLDVVGAAVAPTESRALVDRPRAFFAVRSGAWERSVSPAGFLSPLLPRREAFDVCPKPLPICAARRARKSV